ncbi:Protein of unknown function [Bacillus cytotoxicus]|uniref:Uncharacterized protein n=1 Tax=Bacillus cytotoxicus TaxID=580165 RepID=A0AAX2CL97_9BACI|nr:Protein of unknown function [Bacillus cytotoxicus]SCN41849.1 Protein of unknown function [Bacillus cytotoxicus]
MSISEKEKEEEGE